MAVKRTVEGACEKIVLPCHRDSFYADATSCRNYYRCQGFQVWRNTCPPGTTSMKQRSAPCTGKSWHCDVSNPRKRCSEAGPRQEKEGNDTGNCEFKINLPCKNETRFLDMETCAHYFICKPEGNGQVLNRKPCDLPARCHEMKNFGLCSMADSKQRCLKPGVVAVGGDNPDVTMPGNNDMDTAVDNTSLIIALTLTTFIILLILGFLALICYKRKHHKKQRPSNLPALTIGAPMSINPPSQSIRYSQVDRPTSNATYSEPNNYSTISEIGDLPSPDDEIFNKVESLKSTSDPSGHYEDLESMGLDSPVYSTAYDSYDCSESKEWKEGIAHDESSREAKPVPPVPARTLSLHAKPLSEYARPNSDNARSLYTKPAALQPTDTRPVPQSSRETRPIPTKRHTETRPVPRNVAETGAGPCPSRRHTGTRPVPRPHMETRQIQRPSTYTRPVPRTPVEMLPTPRPPAELPRNSVDFSSGSYSHPYFVLDGNTGRNSFEFTEQTSPRRYFVLEKDPDTKDDDDDTISVGTTYCEIDDDFLQAVEDLKFNENTSSI